MIEDLHVLRVFTDADGLHGNPLGVILGTAGWDEERCQARARELGYSETVFVDDPTAGRVRIFTPAVRLAFAGHPTVGTGWLLHRLGFPVAALHTDAGDVGVAVDGDSCEVTALPAWSPPWELVEVPSPADVDRMVPTDGKDYVWAWVDEPGGVVRARAFAGALGIVEDEATGSAAVSLCGALGRALLIHQGRGSVLTVKPQGDRVALSGRVELER